MVTRRCALFVALLTVAASLVAAPIDDLVALVNETSYRHYLDDTLYTHDEHSRAWNGLLHDLAQASIEAELTSLGLPVTLHEFTYSSQSDFNVVATLTGTVTPERIFIIGAHYDSAGNSLNFRPGADDDASGVAGVIEAARVLSQYDFESTIQFVLFDREEVGLIGSVAYVADNDMTNVQGMVQLDMIAFNPADDPQNPGNPNPNEDHVLLFRSGSNPGQTQLTQDLQDALELFGGFAVADIEDRGANAASDHHPFGVAGVPNALVIEYFPGNGPTGWNPYYHTAGDSVDSPGYIDYAYATAITRGTVGYIAEAAVIVSSSSGVIPEPCTLVILGSGYLGLITVRRRRNRRAA